MAKNADSDAKRSDGGGGGKDAATVAVTGGRALYQGVEREGFGMKMLASMGWEEGKGMGKNGNGITKHLHAKKRAMKSGVGADLRSDASGKMDWTLNAVSFDNILKGLNQAYAATPNDAHEEGEAATAVEATSEGESDEEEKESAKKDKKKDKKKKEEVGRSAVGHAGRYSKRESQKRVKNYSAGDLDAILGGIGGFAVVPGTAAAEYARADAAGDFGAGKSDSDDDPGSDDDDDVKEREKEKEKESVGGGKKEKKKRKREEEKKKKKKNVVEAAEPEKPALPPPPPDWWGWTVGFVPCGYMGKAQDDDDDRVGAECKRGFDEADQERLAMAAHDGANKGKRGLGTGTHVMSNPKKVAGVNWEGKKMKFDEEGSADCDGGGGDVKKSRWGKLAAKMVTKAGGKMLLADVLKKLTKKAKESERKNVGALEDELRAELKRCSSLVVGASLVELRK